MYQNGTVGLLWGQMLLKVPIVSKNASNKNCIKSNFLQKILWVRTSMLPNSGVGAFKYLQFLKYNALEWEW